MNILVTGAGGYLGRGIVKQLLDDGCHVVAVDFTEIGIDPRARIIACDLFSVEDPYTFFDKPDAVLHLAWRNGFVHNHASHIEDLPAHYAFLKKLIEGGIRQVAVMGTMHEVGFFEGAIRDHTPTHPMNPYGISKNALRQLLEALCKGTDVTFQWLRGYYMVAHTTVGNSIFSKLCAAEERGQELFPFTTGRNQYDFLDYDDFCLATAAAVEQTEVTGIINICRGYPERLCDRVERFITENNMKIRLDYGKFPDRPYDSRAVWGDDTKLQRIFAKRGTLQ